MLKYLEVEEIAYSWRIGLVNSDCEIKEISSAREHSQILIYLIQQALGYQGAYIREESIKGEQGSSVKHTQHFSQGFGHLVPEEEVPCLFAMGARTKLGSKYS